VEQAREVVPDDAELKADLAEAAGAARRGRALTRQLLTFAKQEETRPQLLDVNARVLADAGAACGACAGSRAEVTLALAPDAGVVLADPSQLDQVLLNLVTNARDAMPGGGRVHLETAREDGSVRLTVRDTGAGIRPRCARTCSSRSSPPRPRGTAWGSARCTAWSPGRAGAWRWRASRGRARRSTCGSRGRGSARRG
jgi:light-regulated signal transduction histidine kinase (bacteriophytochrome)